MLLPLLMPFTVLFLNDESRVILCAHTLKLNRLLLTIGILILVIFQFLFGLGRRYTFVIIFLRR